MGIFTKKQPYEPVSRAIIFVSDASKGNFCEVLYVQAIVDGRIITENADLVLPLADAKAFNTPDGIVYAFNMNIDYLTEVQHLGEVERNMIIGQAFLYPGRNRDFEKSNLMTYVITGALSLVAIIGIIV